MKKIGIIVGCAVILVGMMTVAGVPKKNGCATIQGGEIETTDGEQITTGYSEWGYNYQAHMFNGMYCDYHPYYRPDGPGHEWCQENYGDVKLIMKWNDAWLSNKDCDGDGFLDRHYRFDSYIGSGAWLTNHMRGSGDTPDDWVYFCKIVAVPEGAYVGEPYNADGNGTWYTADHTEIGPQIWGAFAIIQQVENDPCAGLHGVQYLSPVAPGFGKYKP